MNWKDASHCDGTHAFRRNYLFSIQRSKRLQWTWRIKAKNVDDLLTLLKKNFIKKQVPHWHPILTCFDWHSIQWTFNNFTFSRNKKSFLGSGCGLVGRAVASNTRGPWFESSHRHKTTYILKICLLSTVYWKDKIKKKRLGMAHF